MLVGAVAAEHEVRVAIDEPGSHPRAFERHDFGGAEARELGPLADSDHLAVLDADRGVGDGAQWVAGNGFHRRDIAVDEKAVPHARSP